MKVLIIEDEPQAAQRLETVVKDLEPQCIVLDKIDSIKRSVQWFKENASPDLIFMDIQLADGLSFEIFDKHNIEAPVIFTTAYNEYALKAFKVNSIDYILKPVDKDELSAALDKFKRLARTPVSQSQILESIGQAMQMLTKRFKERFMIKVGEHLRTIEVDSILYFYSQEKATFCFTNESRNFILDYTMEQLDEMIDPARFFRVNRKYIVRAEAIGDIIQHTNSRLKLVLKGSADNDVIVARERVLEFKSWLDR
ncbi:MAG TPA: LytTR family DNA-binding domain-containing protein [Cyclobacteriaceae bacterium]|nr:LytTR family DNA-binding domain-containing protein [Cyclobacteriaceae bacterium]